MELKRVHGALNAEQLLDRVDPLDLSSLPEAVTSRTRQIFGDGVTPEDSVARILREVRDQGDSAVRYYMRLLDGVEPEDLRVNQAQTTEAHRQVSAELKDSLVLAATRIREFHEAIMPRQWLDAESGLGELVRPLERVGLYCPGGTAAYPSTVLMTAIPARVAGVEEIILCTPTRAGQELNPAVLVAAEIAGVDAVYQVGGVPAIGSMAYGTETVPKVDKICGPGNVFVAYAKKLVQGRVDIDGVFGPTETVLVADQGANPEFCAADLIAQAEHDPLATAILITDSSELVIRTESEIDRQLANQPRADMAREALGRPGPGSVGRRHRGSGGLGQPHRSRTPMPLGLTTLGVGSQGQACWWTVSGRIFPRGYGRLCGRPQPRYAHGGHRSLRFRSERSPFSPHHACGRSQ